MKKKRIFLLVLLMLSACSLYMTITLISRQNWYLAHPDFTRFETEEQVEAFLNEQLVIGQTTQEQVTAFLDTQNIQRCEIGEILRRGQAPNTNLSIVVGTTCWVRAPRPASSDVKWYDRLFYEAQNWYYVIQFEAIDGVLNFIVARFEDSYV